MDLLLTIISGVTVLLFMGLVIVMSELEARHEALERREHKQYKRYINNTLSFGNRR